MGKPICLLSCRQINIGRCVSSLLMLLPGLDYVLQRRSFHIKFRPAKLLFKSMCVKGFSYAFYALLPGCRNRETHTQVTTYRVIQVKWDSQLAQYLVNTRDDTE